MFGKDKAEKKEKRFFVKDSQSVGFSAVEILVDRVTGVNYLVHHGDKTTVIPLLDERGNVLVDRTEN